MHPMTDTTPATAHTPATIDTGAEVQAITPREPAPEAVQAYTLASVAYLEATAARYRAEETEARAHAAAHRADPFHTPAERVLLSKLAENRGDNAAQRAQAFQYRADGLRADCPAATTIPPMAVIVLTVQRDRIQQTARLVMGGTRSVQRTWERVGDRSWRSRDADWSEAEDRIGVELCEYMDAVSLPDRVANMLPRPPASKVSSNAGQEVSHA
ncbi:hypothetical protein AB4Y64_09715 [Lysobacter sp. TAF61]|uniref:hypothetical protein n=1 Tax=Lysobacter sp. TAF61 TaxID=3233072 RepID=UPI003F9D4A03